MPTTITSTIKASGGDYTSFAAWVAADGGSASKNLVSEDDTLVCELYNEDFSSVGGHANGLTEDGILSGWTTDSTRNISLKCPDTEKHDGTPESGFFWKQQGAYAKTLDVNSDVPYTTIEDIEFQYVSSQQYGVIDSNAWPMYVERCILNNKSTHVSGAPIATISIRSGHVRSTLLIWNGSAARATSGNRNGNFSSTPFENCTFVRCVDGINNDSTSATYKPLVRNCAFWDCTNAGNDAGSGWHADSGYNASEDSSDTTLMDEVGSSNYGSDIVSGDFEDTANDDYHLASGSALYDIGVDLSSDFDYDIDNDTGIDWSIGMDAGAAGGITGTGALASAASAVAGTGEVTKTGTGALSSQAATVAGTGQIVKTGTGALSAQAAAVAGTGTVGSTITGTAALSAAASAVSGAGQVEKTGTGALSSQAATVAGTGEVTKTGTGALVSAASAVAGVGTVGNAVAGTGDLDAQAAAVAGTGIVGRTGTGALSAQDSAIVGAGTILGSVTGTGALVALDSTVGGTGVRQITGTGALVSGVSSVSGAEIVVVYDEIELAVTITREKPLQITVTREVST